MAFIRVPNTYQFALRGEYLGEEIVNTLYFTGAAPGSPLDPTTFATELIAWWTSDIRPNISAAYTLKELYYIDLDSATGGSGIVNVGVGGTPGALASSAPLPGSVAACISFRTAVRGRSGRGRNYVCGLNEDAVTGNAIAPAILNPILAGYNNLIGTAAGGNAVWVIASRFADKAPRPVGVTYPVTSVLATSSVIAAQRLRTGR